MTAKRTALYDLHKELGAKFTEFAGWEMPVIYTSIVQEHLCVRRSAGLFDISHMGQIFVEGPGAFDFLQKLGTNDLAGCPPGRAIYSHLCREEGGVIDDIFIYALAPERYLVVVNAATADKDFSWLERHKSPDVRLANRSSEFGMIALQGPLSEKIARKIFPVLPERHRILETEWHGEGAYLCRTGYTGEDGFEILLPERLSAELWRALAGAGKEFGLLPCGLGARDTLRLEVGYLLYGQDVDEEHTPLEAGVAWVVKFGKKDFIGRAALEKQKNGGLKKRLAAFTLLERGVPRHGARIFCDDRQAGVVTSGTFSPSLERGIALGYLPVEAAGKFSIECLSRRVPAQKTTLPFLKK